MIQAPGCVITIVTDQTKNRDPISMILHQIWTNIIIGYSYILLSPHVITIQMLFGCQDTQQNGIKHKDTLYNHAHLNDIHGLDSQHNRIYK
jgi:hypothetical protein